MRLYISHITNYMSITTKVKINFAKSIYIFSIILKNFIILSFLLIISASSIKLINDIFT